ncbi:MBL fold metallo-hydrolase [Actinomyces marmotae]|uniref:MBL fold metallo-hydrolase n=1 Tax=Actinomyces marmotae TaxID=2737173 RepID=A0A6M8B055_9ACTO|nr:MBL fold metallo-hydrolase [Actinomyces marmotae]QKD80259.1 MBL fold metallo-hydrolase [Actinomyces marmotae]
MALPDPTSQPRSQGAPRRALRWALRAIAPMLVGAALAAAGSAPAPAAASDPLPAAASASASASDESIHILSFVDSDVIVLQSNGRFALVDSGEDKDYPRGDDPRYPLRPGVTQGAPDEDAMWAYLDELGVNSTNLEFYIGTHAHSDHIGTADTVIEKYHPKRIYTPEYSDAWITSKNNLWDNQYVYDRMIAAARKAQAEHGSALIQHLVPGAPVTPDPSAPTTASPTFDFGDMRIEIVNYDESYKQPPYIYDANESAWGVKVTAHGRSAFLASDIENFYGDEDRLAPLIGDVDVLKLGHHGSISSNSEGFLTTLRPKIAFQTGRFQALAPATQRTLDRLGTRWYSADELRASGHISFVVALADDGVHLSDVDATSGGLVLRTRQASSPHAAAYRNGVATPLTGWRRIGKDYYWFSDSPYATESGWASWKGAWYFLGPDGAMKTGWLKDGTTWYYFAPDSGRMAANRWVASGTAWYHVGGSGAMSTGWLKDGTTWYYLDHSGAMRANDWLNQGGAWYYLTSSGSLATGRVMIDGVAHSFSPSGAWLG